MIMPAGIGRDELQRLTGRGASRPGVLPAGDHDRAHLPGAVTIPLKEPGARTSQLDRSRPVIVYCHDWTRWAFRRIRVRRALGSGPEMSSGLPGHRRGRELSGRLKARENTVLACRQPLGTESARWRTR